MNYVPSITMSPLTKRVGGILDPYELRSFFGVDGCLSMKFTDRILTYCLYYELPQVLDDIFITPFKVSFQSILPQIKLFQTPKVKPYLFPVFVKNHEDYNRLGVSNLGHMLLGSHTLLYDAYEPVTETLGSMILG